MPQVPPAAVESVRVAAESGEQRAARLHAAADRDQAKAERLRAMARQVEQGNAGERRVAELLDVLSGAGWVVLHDRYKSPSSPANLDHLAVGPPGVFVIDAKNWTGGGLRLDERGMALGRYRRDAELHRAAADAALVAGEAVTAASTATTTAVLAFVGDVGPAAPVRHHDVVLLQAEHLPGWLTSQPDRLSPQQVHQVGSTLDAALPPRSGPRRPPVPAAAATGRAWTAAPRRATRRPPAAGTSVRRRPAARAARPGPSPRPARVLRRLLALAVLLAVLSAVTRALPALLGPGLARLTPPAPTAPPSSPGHAGPRS